MDKQLAVESVAENGSGIEGPDCAPMVVKKRKNQHLPVRKSAK